MKKTNPNNLDALGGFMRPVSAAARKCVDVFFARVFPTTIANRYPTEEAKDMEDDLRQLFIDYTCAIMKAEYARLRDDQYISSLRSKKEGFGPQSLYYEREFVDDDIDDDEEGEESEEGEEGDCDCDESSDNSASVDLEDKVLAAEDDAEVDEEGEDESFVDDDDYEEDEEEDEDVLPE
jgi:hypothetical protein